VGPVGRAQEGRQAGAIPLTDRYVGGADVALLTAADKVAEETIGRTGDRMGGCAAQINLCSKRIMPDSKDYWWQKRHSARTDSWSGVDRHSAFG
jgi:hypothetical protein